MCSGYEIIQLDFLPCSLEYLDCSRNNGIINLNDLPNSLIYFICMDDHLTNCNNLPKKLLYISLYKNKLKDIQNLPPNLNKLDLHRYDIDKKIIEKILEENPKIEIIFE